MRQPEVILVVGRNGVGKTTLARKLVSRSKNVCVVSPSGEWGSWSEDVEGLVTRALADGTRTIVLDDCDAYLGIEKPAKKGAPSPASYWRRLLSTNRHLGVDVLLLSRRPQALPLWAVATATRIYAFQLGPRETAWLERTYGVTPPEKAHTAIAISI